MLKRIRKRHILNPQIQSLKKDLPKSEFNTIEQPQKQIKISSLKLSSTDLILSGAVVLVDYLQEPVPPPELQDVLPPHGGAGEREPMERGELGTESLVEADQKQHRRVNHPAAGHRHLPPVNGGIKSPSLRASPRLKTPAIITSNILFFFVTRRFD